MSNKTYNKITVKVFKEKVVESSGSLTQLAKSLGVQRSTLRKWLYKPGNEKYFEMYEYQKSLMVEFSEDVIYEAIVQNRDAKWSAWYLKTMTDKYKEKSQVEVSGDLSIDITITDVKK